VSNKPAALPSTAPRGKQYTVLHTSHVAGPGIHTVEREAGKQLADAQAIARRIDWRLNPVIGLTEVRS
jgi:hypothetical protein